QLPQQRTIAATAWSNDTLLLSAPNDNVLIVPSRNVLLTGSGWRGEFRNTSHDATGPRPAGRIEESTEGSDHTAASRGGTRPERATCSPTAEAVERPRRQGHCACAPRTAVESQAGRRDPANCGGDIEPRSLCGFRPNSGSGIFDREPRHSCRARDRAEVDDRRQTVACPETACGEDPPVAASPVKSGRTGPVGHLRTRLGGGSGAKALSDRHDRRRLQPRSRAVRAARLDRREHASAVELRRAAWAAGQLLHRQSQSVSNGAEDSAGQQRTAAPFE